MEAPRGFVSSTCYDLSQIRADLKKTLSSWGLYPVLSEFDHFPIDPDLSTIENCTAAVRDQADIFVLICGSRYGSVGADGRSVTNLEYLTARRKGVPCYCFVDSKILTSLPVWRDNPDSDFSAVVDSKKVFEFVAGIRDYESRWVFGFTCAEEIETQLRSQIGHLFKDSLKIRERLRGHQGDPMLRRLSGLTLEIYLEKPDGWEYRLLATLLREHLRENEMLQFDLIHGLGSGKPVHLATAGDVTRWLTDRNSDVHYYIDSLTKLIDSAYPDAVGAPGEPGDAQKLVRVAERIAVLHKDLLSWKSSFQDVRGDEIFCRLIELTSKLADNFLESIQKLVEDLENLCNAFDKSDDSIHSKVHVELTVPIGLGEEIEVECQRLAHLLG